MADPNDNDSPLAQSYVDAIKGFEGYTPKATWDVNNWRNGYGTNALHRNEVIDRDEASRRLNRELGVASNLVDTNFPGLPMGARAALTSLTFNAGPGWMSHGLGNAVAKGDFDTARTLMSAYNRSGGRPLPGLTDRRAAEARWFGDAGGDAGALPSVPSSTPLHPAAAAFNRPSAGDPYTAGPAGSSTPSVPQAGDWIKRLFGLGQSQQAPGQAMSVAAGMPDMTSAGSASPAAPQVGQGGAGGAGGGNNLAQIQQIMGILNKQRNAFPFPDFKLDPVQTGPMHPLPLRMAQLNQALPQNLPFAGNSGTGTP